MTNSLLNTSRLLSAISSRRLVTSGFFVSKLFLSTSTRGVSSPLSSYLDNNTAPILVFHKSYCRVCKDLVERIEDGMSSNAMKEIPIDLAFIDRGDALREELRAKTGQKDVPFVFIGKEFIGTVDVLNGLRIKDGKVNDCLLKPKLEKLGIQVTGLFRA